jgi:hypothetical protein
LKRQCGSSFVPVYFWELPFDLIWNVSSLIPLLFIGLLNGIGDEREAEIVEIEDESEIVL